MIEYKVDLETATNDFERWAALWSIDTDVSDLNEEDTESFETTSRKIIKAIRLGNLVVGDDAQLVYTLAFTGSALADIGPIVFTLPTGNAMLQFDKHKAEQNVHKLNAYLGSVTKQSPKIFAQMSELDMRVFHAVALLFLAST